MGDTEEPPASSLEDNAGTAVDGAEQPAPELDPAGKDGEGWPLLHKVAMAAANGAAPYTQKAAESANDSTSGTADPGPFYRNLPSLDDVLAACKPGDVNMAGPGGLTALHMACLGPTSPAQRK
jgi:hypothetical protein